MKLIKLSGEDFQRMYTALKTSKARQLKGALYTTFGYRCALGVIADEVFNVDLTKANTSIDMVELIEDRFAVSYEESVAFVRHIVALNDSQNKTFSEIADLLIDVVEISGGETIPDTLLVEEKPLPHEYGM